MVSKDRRTWTAEQKLQAVLPIIRGEVSLAGQARRLKISETQLYKWREQANEDLRSAFTTGGTPTRERELEQQLAHLGTAVLIHPGGYRVLIEALPRAGEKEMAVVFIQRQTGHGDTSRIAMRLFSARRDGFPLPDIIFTIRHLP